MLLPPNLIITERWIFMKKKITSVLILFILLFTEILILVNSDEVIKAVLFAISIWKENLFPTLFPFFLLSELLIHYGFIDFLGELLKKYMSKLFHLPGEASFVLIGSLVTGFPSSAKYTKELYDNKVISGEEGSYLLTFTHFSNPLFVIGTIGSILLKNQVVAIIILLCHIITNFIIAFLFRPKENKYITSDKCSVRRSLSKMHYKRLSHKDSFGAVLSNTIFNIMNTLFLLLGIISSFLILTSLINNMFVLNEPFKTILNGLLEMSQGVKYSAMLDSSLLIKASLITFIISFGGISVHAQIISIISDTKIEYKYFFIARLFHAIIASCLVYFILSFVNV